MEYFHDKYLIDTNLFHKLIDLAIDDTVHYAQLKTVQDKGAGSFCRFINVAGETYALVSKRAQGLVSTTIKNIMPIINKYESPAPILGAAFDIDEKHDYVIIMPKIEGDNLPSKVYSIEKNIKLAKVTEEISLDAFKILAKDCLALNEHAIRIDFHGGNFIYDKENDRIRMVDLKRRTNFNEERFCSRFFSLFAYKLFQCFKRDGVIENLKENEVIDIDMVTAKSIIKAYSALLSAGLKEKLIAPALEFTFGQGTKIEDFEKSI